MNWYDVVISDWDRVPDFIDHYNNELEDAKIALNVKDGRTVEAHCAELPGLVEQRYGDLQLIEAVLEYFNTMLRKTRSKYFKKYLENYNRDLKSREVEKYIEGEDEVIALALLINEIALLRNRYLGLHKSLDHKSWMLSHITRLKCAGLDDITVN